MAKVSSNTAFNVHTPLELVSVALLGNDFQVPLAPILYLIDLIEFVLSRPVQLVYTPVKANTALVPIPF